MTKQAKIIGLTIAVFFCCGSSFALQTDSLKVDSLNTVESELKPARNKSPYLEVYKFNGKRTFKLTKNQHVRVYSFRTKNGRMKTKAAIITEIRDHEITFVPTSKQFDEITYADSSMTYIEIATTGSVIRGIVIDALLVSAVVITVGVIIIGSIVAAFYGGSSLGGSGSGIGNLIEILPWNNFHKHIKFTNHRGIQKWGARVVGS